jgi:hypothetical protein
MSEKAPADLSDIDLLRGIGAEGEQLLATSKNRQAAVGSITDDSRWASPLPLRFEVQLAMLFLGALDAYEVTSNILLNRASQQAFNGLRFQLETLALIRWLVHPTGAGERQARSYRIVYGQITRWAKLLKEDVSRGADDSDVLDRVNTWKERLQELATEDGLTLNVEPDRKYLFNNFVPESGYPTFSMYSELGAHPGAIGNTLFSLQLDSREIAYTLGEAYVDRGFWLSASVTHLWNTCESVAASLGWDEWLGSDARPIFVKATPLMNEVLGRRRREPPT